MEVTLTEAQAKAICELYDGIESSDAIYRNCQSNQFRTFVQTLYKAANVEKAVGNIKEQLKSMK